MSGDDNKLGNFRFYYKSGSKIVVGILLKCLQRQPWSAVAVAFAKVSR